MGIAGLLLTAVIAGGPVGVGHAGAQTASCPLQSNDECDQWQFEQAGKELAAVVDAARANIDRLAHPDTRAEAKDRLDESQRLWEQVRAADCHAKSALMWLRSARTRAGYTAACMYDLTAQRIAELKNRYFLNK